jgi:hypothetical protein
VLREAPARRQVSASARSSTKINVELRRDVTAGKAIENAVAALGAAFADDHFRQRRVGPAGENRDRGT